MEKVKKTWDTHYATYYWNIFLKPEYCNGATVLTGYSKKCEQNEAQDKIMLLRKKIVSLYTNGYLLKSERIEFFMRKDFVINKRIDPKILILQGSNYNFPEESHEYMFKNHGEFLKNFCYEITRAKPDLELLVPRSRKMANQDDFLNVQKCSFQNEGQLYSYASRLINYGHAPGAVNNFIHQYKSLKNWK